MGVISLFFIVSVSLCYDVYHFAHKKPDFKVKLISVLNMIRASKLCECIRAGRTTHPTEPSEPKKPDEQRRRSKRLNFTSQATHTQ